MAMSETGLAACCSGRPPRRARSQSRLTIRSVAALCRRTTVWPLPPPRCTSSTSLRPARKSALRVSGERRQVLDAGLELEGGIGGEARQRVGRWHRVPGSIVGAPSFAPSGRGAGDSAGAANHPLGAGREAAVRGSNPRGDWTAPAAAGPDACEPGETPMQPCWTSSSASSARGSAWPARCSPPPADSWWSSSSCSASPGSRKSPYVGDHRLPRPAGVLRRGPLAHARSPCGWSAGARARSARARCRCRSSTSTGRPRGGGRLLFGVLTAANVSSWPAPAGRASR